MDLTHTFTIWVTAPAATEDGDGYTPEEIERLLKQTLHYYAAPLNKERRVVTVDWERLTSDPVT